MDLTRSADLNPTLTPEQLADMHRAVKWGTAPTGADGFVAVFVGGRTRSIWILSDGVTRAAAPDFIQLVEGHPPVMLRRPDGDDGRIMSDRIKALLWHHTGLNNWLELQPPDPDYKPGDGAFRVNPLAAGIAAVVHYPEA